MHTPAWGGGFSGPWVAPICELLFLPVLRAHRGNYGVHRVLAVRLARSLVFPPGARGGDVLPASSAQTVMLALVHRNLAISRTKVAVAGASPPPLGALLLCRSQLRDLRRVSALPSFHLPSTWLQDSHPWLWVSEFRQAVPFQGETTLHVSDSFEGKTPPASCKSRAPFSASRSGAIKRKNRRVQAGKQRAGAGSSGECFQGTLAGGFSLMKDFPGTAPAQDDRWASLCRRRENTFCLRQCPSPRASS